jgi:hypothetical protein
MKRGTMSKKAFEAAYANGEPKASGPKCATCGDLAAWGTHPACERRNGKLLVWIPVAK